MFMEFSCGTSTGKKRNIWIDCDPGIDDAVALAVAAASREELNLLGISTVSGNQNIALVTENARKLAAFYGVPALTVIEGAGRPLVREAEDAGDIHGETGLGYCVLPPVQNTRSEKQGIAAIYDRLMSLPEGETFTLVPTGPLTNIALLLRSFPDVKERIDGIVLMGGSSKGGNVTPHAEFNIWADPEAAKMVLAEKLPIMLCGLDVTNHSGLTGGQVDELCINGGEIQRACGQMLKFYLDTAKEPGMNVVGIHDAVTILFLTNPELFQWKKVAVEVDCSWGEYRGRTICLPPQNNEEADGVASMLCEVDVPAFQKILLRKLESLEAMKGHRSK